MPSVEVGVKYCYCCKRIKFSNEFYKNSSKKDGLATECKACKKISDKKYGQNYYLKNKEKIKQRNKKYGQTEKGKEVRKRIKKNFRKNHLEQCRSYDIFCNAIERGKIKRPNKCDQCFKKCKPDGHHIDYNKPLEVVWLCRQCHSNEHRKVG